MKRQVLFVDDDPNVLQGLRRIMRPLRDSIDTVYVESANEALRIMSDQKFDVVISDMRMPGIDGASFLNEVKKQHPIVVRIVLSGYSNDEMVMRSLESAHQYLLKPCKPEIVKAIIDRACISQDLLADDQVKNLISAIKTIPSLPRLYQEIIDELKKTEASIKRVGEIISQDASMCAKILQLVNSAFFGVMHHISDPVDAIKLLGIDTIKSLVLVVKVFAEFQPAQNIGFSMQAHWGHSIQTGVFAQCIARLENAESSVADGAFSSGMLHDIGKLLIAVHLPEQYTQVQLECTKQNIPQWQAEMQLLAQPMLRSAVIFWVSGDYLMRFAKRSSITTVLHPRRGKRLFLLPQCTRRMH